MHVTVLKSTMRISSMHGNKKKRPGPRASPDLTLKILTVTTFFQSFSHQNLTRLSFRFKNAFEDNIEFSVHLNRPNRKMTAR